MSEHDLQVTVFDWIELEKARIPELGHIFAIPNGGHRHPSVGAKMKREGVRAGVPDCFLAIPKGKYHGLFIEHKWGKNQLTLDQKVWRSKLERYNYMYLVSRSFEETQDNLLGYLGE